MIDVQNFFYQPIKNDLKTYNYILKIATIQGNDYATGCLLDYTYFKEHYNLIAIDLSKQQRLDVNPKERTNWFCWGGLDIEAKMYFIIEAAKEKPF